MNLSEEVQQTVIVWKELLGLNAEQLIHIELQLMHHSLHEIATKFPTRLTTDLAE